MFKNREMAELWYIYIYRMKYSVFLKNYNPKMRKFS